MKEKNILVVDDDAMNLRMAEWILQKEYTVHKAESGMACLAFLQTQSADLILLDMEMPQMNGFQTLEAILELPGGSDIPIVFLSSDTSAESMERAKQYGIKHYITKPFLPQTLCETVIEIFSDTK